MESNMQKQLMVCDENHAYAKYNKFRTDYPAFFYRRAEIKETEKELQLVYHFEIPGLSSFAPAWTFPKPAAKSGQLVSQHPLMKKMIFNLGMVELVSYWKITCSPKVVIEAGALTGEQIEWWKELYFHGLGEFFYVNQIHDVDPQTFMEITAGKAAVCRTLIQGADAGPADQAEQTGQTGSSVKVLVPVGGGKDSVVTLELLREAGEDIYGYIINPRGATLDTLKAAQLPADKCICVNRTLDKNMLQLNQQGFLNGHTPFSALVAFSSLITAFIYDIPYIALSNESSANESTVKNSSVNHQYSKSFKFEQDFHDYAKVYLAGSGYYFSMLRPLSELQIARLFAGQKAYHRVFKSCNAGSKTNSWCGKCPKCLFVYLILSPYLSQEELAGIFGKNLLADRSLEETLQQLVGVKEEKPFECVGSRDEVREAIELTIGKMEKAAKPLPYLLAEYRKFDLSKIPAGEAKGYDCYFDEENLIPERWVNLVKDKSVNADMECIHERN